MDKTHEWNCRSFFTRTKEEEETTWCATTTSGTVSKRKQRTKIETWGTIEKAIGRTRTELKGKQNPKIGTCRTITKVFRRTGKLSRWRCTPKNRTQANDSKNSNSIVHIYATHDAFTRGVWQFWEQRSMLQKLPSIVRLSTWETIKRIWIPSITTTIQKYWSTTQYCTSRYHGHQYSHSIDHHNKPLKDSPDNNGIEDNEIKNGTLQWSCWCKRNRMQLKNTDKDSKNKHCKHYDISKINIVYRNWFKATISLQKMDTKRLIIATTTSLTIVLHRRCGFSLQIFLGYGITDSKPNFVLNRYKLEVTAGLCSNEWSNVCS